MSQTLLVVDDEPAIQKMLHKRGEKDGFQVIGALTLREGLRRAVEDAPDIILLDMSLPDGMGSQLLKQLQAEPRTRHIPIVVWSGMDRTETREKVLRAGAVAYLHKNDMTMLMVTLRAMSRGSQTRVIGSRQIDYEDALDDLAPRASIKR
ncbi:MAG: phoB [Polyangiaceae bacterium]|jgi:DNA-binding response OmpR family regulator|nr:phoB [Polyangiaceae bacterium]